MARSFSLAVFWLTLLCFVGIACSVIYWLASLACTIAFFRRRPTSPMPFTPSVSVLKPMRGLDDDLEENLRAFCEQDYPTYQILFGVESADEPCVPIIRKVIAEFPDKDIELLICGRNGGANRKVNNLRSILARAKHDVLVLADSDIRVGSDYLERIVAPLADERVGLVCCPYRWKSPRTLPAAIEALTFCVEFVPSVLLDERMEGLKFALGATIAVRRRCVQEIGGFEAIQDFLADDFKLGKSIHDRGHKLVLSDYVVDLIHHDASWHRMMQHQTRLVRTYRVCRPIGFFFSILTHGTTWATLFLLLTHFSPIGWSVCWAVLGLRFVTSAIYLLNYFPDLLTTGYLWLLPLRDWLGTVWWLAAYTGNRVRWRGSYFTLTPDGKLHPIPESSLAVEPGTVRVD